MEGKIFYNLEKGNLRSTARKKNIETKVGQKLNNDDDKKTN